MPGTFSRVGQFLGEKAGGYIGKGAGSAVASLLGAGDYDVNNIISTGSTYPAQMAITGSSDGSLVISNVETVLNIVSTGSAFSITTYANNPGLSNFPWLSAVATRFNKYRFKQLVYEFVSTCSEYTAGAAMGSVAISTNYDALDRSFATMTEVEATHNAVSGKPSISKLHGVECARLDDSFTWRYVRAGPVTSGDLRVYDQSITTVATEGLAAAAGTVIGKLRVLYTVELREPVALGLPALILPAPGGLRALGAPASGAAGVGPFWGVTALAQVPSSTAFAINNLPYTIGGGATVATTSPYPVFDVTGATLSFYVSGRFRLVSFIAFSTVPTAFTTETVTVTNGTQVNPFSGAASLNTWNPTDKTTSSLDVLIVSTGSQGNPCAVVLAQTGWGATFVINANNLCVEYVGPL
jgi:hypothetical protein